MIRLLQQRGAATANKLLRSGRPSIGVATSTSTYTYGSKTFSTKPAPSHPSESFLSGTSSVYAEQMLAAFKKDPESVHVSWRSYFENLESGIGQEEGAFEPLPTIQKGAAASISRMVSTCRDCPLKDSFRKL
jgi:hypothetical protein